MIFPQLELLLAKPDSRQFPLKLCRKLLLVVDEYPREVEFFYLQRRQFRFLVEKIGRSRPGPL
jgi:hypothetical protein